MSTVSKAGPKANKSKPAVSPPPASVAAYVPRVPWNPGLAIVFAVLIFYGAQLGSGLILLLYSRLQHWPQEQAVNWLNNSVTSQFVFILLAETFIIGAIYSFLKRRQLTPAIIGLKRPRWLDMAYGLMAYPPYYLFYFVAVGIIGSLVPSLNVNQQQQIGFNDVQGSLQLAMTFISLVVLPPLAEEILFRGFLYSSFKKAVPTLWAALLTSTMFAAAHLSEGGTGGPLYIAALDTFVLSLVLIYLREKTGSLWASITLHALKNGVAFVALFVLHIR